MTLPKAVSKSVALCLAAAATLISINMMAIAGEGAVDTTFTASANNTVYCTQVQPNGRILIGGAFTTVNGVQRYGFARLFPDGSLDPSITNVLNAGGTVYAMLVQPDGKFVLGGNFFASSPTQAAHQNVVRLNVDGSVDGTFTNSAPNAPVYALAQQADGKILIGGQFYVLGNSNRYDIARLNIDGTVDSSFNPGGITGSGVNAIAVQNDGNILIGGAFSQFSTYGLSRTNISRLTTNGTPDLSYAGSAISTVQAVYLENSGKSVWTGFFTTMDNGFRSHVGRLNPDGTLDGTFTTPEGPNGNVYDVAEDANNNIYVGGQFNSYNNGQHTGVARLFSDGTLDSNFNSTTNFPLPVVRCLALQGDGKVIVGGSFSSWNSLGHTNLVRLYGNNYPAEIVTQPRGTNVTVGANVTFSVNVSNPTAVGYQWYYNGSPIYGATDNEYSIFNAQLDDAGTYSVFVNTSVGGTTSSNAVLQVGIAPAITQQPTNLTLVQGDTATFTAAASGTPLNYYWKLSNQLLVGTNATLTLTNVTPSQAGTYVFIASNFLGAATSAPVALTVLYPVTIFPYTNNQSIVVGQFADFLPSATGNPIYFQWWKNGSPIPGATNMGYIVQSATLADAGTYSLVASNQFNSASNLVGALTVGSPPQNLSFHLNSSGFPVISMPGTTNFNYSLQTTTNLTPPVTWRTITNLPADTNGNWRFTDTNSPSGAQFYRIAAP